MKKMNLIEFLTLEFGDELIYNINYIDTNNLDMLVDKYNEYLDDFNMKKRNYILDQLGIN